MQDAVWVAANSAELLAAGQVPLLKFEIYVGAEWINLCNMPNERLTDGRLEEWLTPTNLQFWTEAHSGVGVVARESVVVHSGTYSCRLYTPAAGNFASILQDFILVPLDTYTVKVWYLRAAHASSNLRLYISDTGFNVYLKADGTWTAAATIIPLTVSAVWKLFELEFTAHADYTDYQIKIYKDHTAGGAISFYVDDLSVAEYLGNYVKATTISLGGASKTPNPVAGEWGATLSNEDSLFHPQHPTSDYADYLKSGRKVRLSIGATYSDGDHYWQRLIGYMDEPKLSTPDYKAVINGGDYMKMLRDTELKSPDNYWGDSETYPSIPSDGMAGAEVYDLFDAMTIGVGEANNVATWTPYEATFVSFADVGGGSAFVGKLVASGTTPHTHYAQCLDVGDVVAGTEYRIRFNYKRVFGITSPLILTVKQDIGGGVIVNCGTSGALSSDDWDVCSFYFTAVFTGALILRFGTYGALHEFRIDNITIDQFTPYWERYYELLGLAPVSKGPYYVTVDGVPCWQGEGDECWDYAKEAELGPDPPAHPAEIVYFNINKEIPLGVDIIVYYFTQQAPEDVVADLLVLAGIADALEFDATGITIDNVWFKAGTTCLKAIKMLCEVCDYRFYFKYDGTPVFKPKPAGATVFTFTDPKHIASSDTYQDRNEIRNRIVIKGIKQAAPISKEETMPSEIKHEVSDADSITAYGEKTLTINNHLFQVQADLDAMCDTLLAEYKDPKWYSNIVVPFNPVPLEMGDKIQWEERLSPILDLTRKGWIRDIKINLFSTTYICELDL